MSYCRWSSDDYQCDIYCYADVSGGYTIHVASNRITFKEPLPPSVGMDNAQEWLFRHQKVSEMIKDADTKDIGLEYDGRSFYEKTPQDFLARLLMLREVGYRFPDYVLKNVRDEMDDAE